MSRRAHISREAAALAQAPLPTQVDLEDYLDPSRRQALQSEISAYTQKTRGRLPDEPSARKVVAPIDRYRAQLPAELEDAARQLVRLFLLAESSPRVTQTFDASPKGRNRNDLQGEIRDAKVLVEKMRSEWPEDAFRDVLWFVAIVVQRADGSPMRLEDSGALILPNRSAEAQKWVGYGALYRTLQLASQFLARQRALGQTGAISSTGDRQVLMAQLKSLALQRQQRNSGRE